MSNNFDRRFPSFILGMDDRLTIEGKAMRLSYMSGEHAVLVPADGHGLAETFEFSHLNRLSAAGKILHEIEYFLPSHMRTQRVRSVEDMTMPQLAPAHRLRVNIRFAMVQALLELNDKARGKDRIKMDDASIEANLAKIRDHAADYLEQDDVNPEAAERLRQYRCGEGKKPRGGGAALLPEAANARTLRKWLARLVHSGRTGGARP